MIVSPFSTPAQRAIAQARAIPVIRPAIAAETNPPQPSIIQSATIPLTTAGTQNSVFPFMARGDFVYISSISPAGSEIRIGPIGQPLTPVDGNRRFIRFKNGYDGLQIQNTESTPVTVVLRTGFGEYREDDIESQIAQSVPLSCNSSDTFNRPANATPYDVGDVVGERLEFAGLFRSDSLGNLKTGRINLEKVRIVKNSTTVLNAAFRLYLFAEGIGVGADNAAFELTDAKECVGYIDLAEFTTEGAGSTIAFAQKLVDMPVRVPLAPAATVGSLYGVLVARSGYVPTNGETFTVYLDGTQY